MFECPAFVSTEFCDTQIADAEAQGFSAATINSEAGTQVAPDIRNNGRIICDKPALAAKLWDTARTIVPPSFKGRAAAGLNERFRLYRYTSGQFFDWHQDGSYRADDGR